MIFITQTNTGIFVKRAPQEQIFDTEAILPERSYTSREPFSPSSGFVMLMSVGYVLIS